MRDLIYEMSNTACAILKVCCGDGVRSFPQSPLIASRWESVELLHSLEGGMGDDSGRSYAVEPSWQKPQRCARSMGFDSLGAGDFARLSMTG